MSNGGNSSLDIRCPKCDKQLRLNAQLAGKRVKCPACSTVLRVPGPVNSASTDDDWLQLDSEPTPSQNPPDASAQGEPQPTKPVSIKPTESRQATGTIPNVAAPQENKKGESSSGSSSNSSVKTPSIFDDDLPELAELEPAKPKQSILLGTGELEELVPRLFARRRRSRKTPVPPQHKNESSLHKNSPTNNIASRVLCAVRRST